MLVFKAFRYTAYYQMIHYSLKGNEISYLTLSLFAFRAQLNVSKWSIVKFDVYDIVTCNKIIFKKIIKLFD